MVDMFMVAVSHAKKMTPRLHHYLIYCKRSIK